MLAKTAPFKLFQPTHFPEPEPTLEVYNMHSDWYWALAYKRLNRHLCMYYKATSGVNKQFKIHRSVIRRIESGKAPTFKVYRKHKDWFQYAPFAKCFEQEKGTAKWKFKEDCDCIKVIEYQ
jgi:hypothetical protein